MYESIFIVIGAFIAGTFTLTGVLTSYLLTKKITKWQRFNKAASDFHTAFIKTQRRLDINKGFNILKTGGEGVWDILQQFIVSHERAMIKFRPYINKCKLASFNEAWKIYYSQENKHAERLVEYKPEFHHGSKDPKLEDEIRKLALSRIEKLLSFTEIKNT
jgi:hypothetical protein